jgi:predicted dithiol-disulfide oxidoreductase (DUF899 family)
VFCNDEVGRTFHTYSTFGRGDEQFMTTYGFLDVTPKRAQREPAAQSGRLGPPA